MLRLLFTTEDNSKQLTVMTDGLDSQLNVFVTENVVGAIEYYKSIGITIEPGHTYNIGQFKEWCYDAFIKLIAYPEGFEEEAVVLTDIKEEYVYKLTTDKPVLNFAGTGGQDMCVVTSTKQMMKNGKPEGAEEGVPVTFATSSAGFTVHTDRQVEATVNPTDQKRNGVVTVTQEESGKTLEIQLVQAGSVITYKEVFTVSPQSLKFTAMRDVKDINVVSRRNKLVNSNPSDEYEEIPTNIELTGEGFSYSSNGTTIYKITAEENTAETQKTATATISQIKENGKSVTVNITQAAANVTYEYTCTVNPTTLSFAAAGGTKTFGVTATKQKKVNGSDSGTPSEVTCTTTVKGEGFKKGPSEHSVEAEVNAGAQRTGTAVVTTTEGNKTATVTLTQSEAGA